MKRCYLYWIRSPHMKDVKTQGYVGISHNPKYRLKQHISKAKRGLVYNKEFLKFLKNGQYVQEILLEADVKYCKNIEKVLRPNIHIGWNVAIGGDGGVLKHGLTGTPCKKSYYNMLTNAAKGNIPVSAEWLGEMGLLNFSKFYDKIPDGYVLSIAGLQYISHETVRIVSRKESLSVNKRVHDVYMDGVMRTVSEVADLFKIKPNTISTAMKRGYTIRQAVGLDEKPQKTVRVKEKPQKTIRVKETEVPYAGRIPVDVIEMIGVDYESGMSLPKMASKYNMNTGSIYRLCKKFGYTRDTCRD